jgi:hypothetical protein
VIFKNQSHLRNLSWLAQIANGCDDITEILLKVALNTITFSAKLKCHAIQFIIQMIKTETIAFFQNHGNLRIAIINHEKC